MKAKRNDLRIRACAGVCIFVMALICSGLPAYAAETNSGMSAPKTETITVYLGESTIVKAPWPTIRVAVTDPKIADVKILTPNEILLQGNKLGSTDLILWGKNESEGWQRKVCVYIDLPSLKNKLGEMFSNCPLEVSQSGEVLIVKGLLRNADQAVQLKDFLDKLKVTYSNMTSVAGIQQVQLQVRVAEVSRVALRALGINSFQTDKDFFYGSRVGSSSGGAIIPSISIGPASGAAAGDNSLGFAFNSAVTPSINTTVFAGFPHSNLEVFLNALAENQYLKILANPTLVALSGEEASFLAGGEYPIPVVQGTGGGTSVTIEYRQFGVRLSFRPIVLGDNTIRLYVAPEVSSLSTVGALTLAGTSVPSLTVRKAETTLELKSGQTFAMAGLIKRDIQARTSRIPGIGDLPIIGSLFRSVSYEDSETELVVLVTASMVEPLSVAATPPLPGFLHVVPNDWEFYLEGRIEGKEPAKVYSTDAAWLKQIGLDRLVGPGAWDSYDKAAPPSEGELAAPKASGNKNVGTQGL